jgi:MoxR-like ATPase
MSAREQISGLRKRMQQPIVGQLDVIDRLVYGLLANGNLLIEGLPGLAKTRAIKALSKNVGSPLRGRECFAPGIKKRSSQLAGALPRLIP